MLTFLISGLWHGAGINYILWGGIHGIYQVAEVTFKTNGKNKPALLPNSSSNDSQEKAGGKLRKAFSLAATFFAVCFAWVFFRAETLSDAWRILSLSFYGIDNFSEYLKTAVICLDMSYEYMVYLCIPVLLLILYDYASLKTNVIQYISSKKIWVRYPVYIFLYLLFYYFRRKESLLNFIIFSSDWLIL